MPRKKEPSSVTEKEVFPTRLRELMRETGTTQKKLADAVGVRPQTISLYATGQSYPDVNGIRKIAEYFEVCSDYLLGLSDAPTTEPYMRAVVDSLGLSYRAVAYLFSISETQKKPHEGVERMELLSFFLSKPLFDMMLCECCIYIDRMREEYDQKFIHSEEYGMCAEILKKHGFAINTKEQQAAYCFNERIVFFFRELLNQYVNPKTDEEILEEMENAKYSGEDDEDWE